MGGGVAFWSPDDATYGWSLPTDWLRRTSSLGRVQGLCTYGGDLVVAGSFVGAGTTSLSNIALWNGTQWNELGGGINGPVHDIAIASNGDLIAVGEFNMAGGTTCRRIARWNGSTWSPVGYGMTGGAVTAVACMPNGDICVGGQFTAIGSVAANGLARWDGAAWSALPGGVANATVDTMAALPNGDLVVGGNTQNPWPTPPGTIGGVPSNLVVWDGSSWSASIPVSMNFIGDVHVRANGDIVVGGRDYGGWPSDSVVVWDGTTPQYAGHGIGDVHAITDMPNGDLLACGAFSRIYNDVTEPPTLANNIAIWDGSWWRAPGGGFHQPVIAMDTLPNGDLVCISERWEIWRWDGSWWHKLPVPPIQSEANDAFCAAVHPASGNLFVGGDAGIAEWDGQDWAVIISPASPQSFQARGLTFLANGELVAVGEGGAASSGGLGDAARWNGNTWTSLGLFYPLSTGRQHTAITLSDGSLMAGGDGNSFCHRWTGGTSWQGVGSFFQPVRCLLETTGGDVIAGGDFSIIDGQPRYHIARWDGNTWHALGNGLAGDVTALFELPDGDLLAGVSPDGTGPQPAQVWRWNGSWWSLFAETNTQELAVSGFSSESTIRCMHLTRDGDLAVGGSFLTFDGAFSPHVAILEPTCPAAATIVSGGCGTATLERGNLPWIGGTWTYRGVDMPPLTLAVAVTGFGLGSVPLSPALPQAQPGCDLLVSPGLLDVQFSNTSVVEGALAIPHDPALIGGVFYQQLLPFEVDASLAVVEVTATNALSLTIGAF